MTTFHLPDLGEGLQEAEIVAWHVGVGDHVVADQPLVSVETEKAVVEIPSPRSGRIQALRAKVGDIVRIGAELVVFEDAAARDAGTVVGSVPDVAAAPAPSRPAPRGIQAAPAMRALARTLGVDLTRVEGTGPHGAITRSDVEKAAEPTATVATGPREPLRGVRRAMARNMERSHAEVVPATVLDVADIDDWSADADATLRLIRAVAAACAAEPALNAWYFGRDAARQLHAQVDLGMAMDTEDGLIVPVLRDVARRAPDDLRQGLQAMKAAVRSRSVTLEELRGATITLSNFGMFGGQHAALVVVPPQVAIVGAGRIHPRVVPVAGRPAVRRALPLSLTFDHRSVMGGEASRFLAAAIADLEKTA